jgi:beta-galactosidase
VQVELDPSSVAPQANQNDVVFIRARLLDNHQNPVHLNQAKVQFNLEGDAEWVSPNLIETEDGVASALLKIGANLSSIKISASYQNIKSNSLALPGSHEAEK